MIRAPTEINMAFSYWLQKEVKLEEELEEEENDSVEKVSIKPEIIPIKVPDSSKIIPEKKPNWIKC